MLVKFGKAGWVSKARQQPDKVRMVAEKVRTDGALATLNTVRSKLDQPLALGYSNAGVVTELGAELDGFEIGDRVVSNGKHAEYVSVPKNLCVKIPDAVSFEAASFTVLAAIGLQGIRLANPTIGECIAVSGVGLIGLLTVQMLRAHGCRVLAFDFDASRLALARRFGAETVDLGAGQDVQAAALSFSRGKGMDAVIITASTDSTAPVNQAARMCRKRGRIVLIGVTGLELSRTDFYEKELTFQVSCSYGPGRYDPSYEEGGHDYPIGFVRWTEQRNFEAVLDLMASGAIDVAPLITHRFALEKSEEAMGLLTSTEPSLGIVIQYPQDYGADISVADRRVTLAGMELAQRAGQVAFLGAGNYAGRVLIPAFRQAGAHLNTVVSSSGVSAVHFGKKFGFSCAATDSAVVLADSDIDTVVIATRHNAHAAQVIAALEAGKHVFCEKPLCLTLDELEAIRAIYLNGRQSQQLMVGFNRRFAPQIVKMKVLLSQVDAPKSFIVTVNAGEIPSDHWTQMRDVGGGRIKGEVCHFIDLLRYLAGAEIIRHQVVALGQNPGVVVRDDKVSITLQFADGSFGTIHYLANGHKAVPKERIEVFAAGRVIQLDNFRKLRGWGWRGFSKMDLWRQDKGQVACATAFLGAIRRGGRPAIEPNEVFEVARATIEIADSLG